MHGVPTTGKYILDQQCDVRESPRLVRVGRVGKDENRNGILRSFHKKAIEWSQWSQVGTLV